MRASAKDGGDASANVELRSLLREGTRPSAEHSIERIRVGGDYEPSNCRWATKIEQARNKRSNRLVECDGRMVPMSEAAEFHGIPYKTVASRLPKGWSSERAVSEPVSEMRKASQFRSERLVDISKRTGIPIKTIQARLRRGWAEDRAFSEGAINPIGQSA